MANYGDFNFNDDNPSPDTDPTLDNNQPEIESSSDNRENDKTNYPEPGEGETVKGGDVTDFGVYGNPEEPGSQQDHVAQVSISPKRPDTVAYRGRNGHWQRSLPKRKAVGSIQIDENGDPYFVPAQDTTSAKRAPKRKKGLMYTEYTDDGLLARVYPLEDRGDEPVEDVTGLGEWIAKVSKLERFKEDNAEDPTGLGNFIEKLFEAGYELPYSPVNFTPNVALQHIIKAFGMDIDYDEGKQEWDTFFEKLYSAGFQLDYSPVELSDSTVFDRIQKAFANQDEIDPDPTGLRAFVRRLGDLDLPTTFKPIPVKTTATERFEASKRARRRPVAYYDADTEELMSVADFDNLLMQGFDEDILPDASLSDPDGLESLDVLDIIEHWDSIDLQDVLDDAVQNSNVLEFQNPDALENHDGLF